MPHPKISDKPYVGTKDIHWVVRPDVWMGEPLILFGFGQEHALTSTTGETDEHALTVHGLTAREAMDIADALYRALELPDETAS